MSFASALKRQKPVRFAAETLRGALSVNEPVRFIAGQVLRERGTYTGRGGHQPITVRHRSGDIAVLIEIFQRGVYRYPEPASPVEKIIDLGANVGVFCAYALTRHPGAEVVAYEPDAANAALIVDDDRVTVVPACAGNHTGTVPFTSGRHAMSRIEDGGEPMPLVDVLPLDADLVKIDIEGGEWEILRDERFPGSRPKVLLLEWHAVNGGNETEAIRLLERRGFAVRRVGGHAFCGTVWASR